MVYNNEINKNESDIINSSDLDKNSQDKNLLPSDSTSVIQSNLPSFKKILVTYDDSGKSDKAINYSIYVSNISGAEIVILQVLGNIDKLENSSLDVSNKNKNIEDNTTASSSSTNDSDIKSQNYSVNVKGQIIESMEDKIKSIENTGFNNKVSYKIRSGFIVDEIVKETLESKYDLLIISSSHMDSWIKSLFSETRKIISNVDIPVLLLH
ncbi:MAG: universal stress protein [Candidatus Nitrosocosmicus sp.]|nr:universal stress protein [Candidatus Nitrosocosmicus sp.]MDN5866872.1 universal stress protein [Candidatus Nitrosocosmicus sp.]